MSLLYLTEFAALGLTLTCIIISNSLHLWYTPILSNVFIKICKCNAYIQLHTIQIIFYSIAKYTSKCVNYLRVKILCNIYVFFFVFLMLVIRYIYIKQHFQTKGYTQKLNLYFNLEYTNLKYSFNL